MILIGGLRTGFHTNSKVFSYRDPSVVVGTLISNNLATLVISPEKVNNLIVLSNTELDQTFHLELSRFTDIEKSVISVVYLKSFLQYFEKINFEQPVVIISALNQTKGEFDNSKYSIQTIEAEIISEEKLPIEISNSIVQENLWYEDSLIKLNTEEIIDINGVVSMIFTNKIGNLNGDFLRLYNLEVIKKISFEDQYFNEILTKTLKEVDFSLDWVFEFDYLNIANYEIVKLYFEERNTMTSTFPKGSINYGNSLVLNGFRAINAAYHKLNQHEKRNGLILIEENNELFILQLQRIQRSD